MTRKPSTSGPTRISSRGTSEPVTSAVSVKSERWARATETASGAGPSVLEASCAAGWQMAAQNEGTRAGSGEEPDRHDDGFRFHWAVSLALDASTFSGAITFNKLDRMPVSTGMTALASKFGSTARRQNMPSPMTDNTVAMVSRSCSGQYGRRAWLDRTT